MTDLSKTIEPKSDQMNADDLIGGPAVITITDVRGGDDIQPININYEGDNGKPYKPCKSMRRVLVKAWGTEGKSYVGKSMRLFCDPKVKFGGIEVGGIRISEMTDLPEASLTMALTVSKANRKPYTVKRMDPPAGQKSPAPTVTKEQAIEQASAAATCGTVAFREWFNSEDGKQMRSLFKDDALTMAKLKTAATEADENATADMVEEEFGEM